jgi:predicted DsbA family dithiol-disulfide isomerase
MRIDIVSDTICPWCFIGKRRLERALAERTDSDLIELGWRPFQLNPDMPDEGMERHAYLAAKFGGAERAERIYAPIVEAGAGEGINFAFEKIVRTPNTALSHRLIRRAGELGNQDAAVEALFRAYFTEGRDIGDPGVVADIAGEAGLPRKEIAAYLASDTDRHAVAAEDMLARKLGIQGVPCFIIDRRVMVSGAQTPEILMQAFDYATREAANADTQPGD